PSIDDGSIDAVLTFDVLHYLEKEERNSLYKEIKRILKPEGRYYVYPKHNKSDWPMWSISKMNVDDIIKEIMDVGFKLEWAREMDLFHDDDFDVGLVVQFLK
ncbi:MAG: class I SAM-dependent methyltransferase, partial [Promethearchaeota archaeon]